MSDIDISLTYADIYQTLVGYVLTAVTKHVKMLIVQVKKYWSINIEIEKMKKSMEKSISIKIFRSSNSFFFLFFT